MGITVYSLHLTFGLLVLPEFAPFSHTAYLEAKLVDIGMYTDITFIHNKVGTHKAKMRSLLQLGYRDLDSCFYSRLQFLPPFLVAVTIKTSTFL